jgi:hypothetical protein
MDYSKRPRGEAKANLFRGRPGPVRHARTGQQYSGVLPSPPPKRDA